MNHLSPCPPMRLAASAAALLLCTAGAWAAAEQGASAAAEHADAQSAWTFVSIPDFLNVDIDYPQPQWEDALGYVLRNIKAEGPDFILVAGDLLMGRWWKGPEQIERLSAVYYPAWIKRLEAHGLKFYAAVGDHELGDNPWKGERLEHVPHYEQAFVRYMKMPTNGPDHMKGLAYWFTHRGTLVVSVDVFEKEHMGAGKGTATVTGEQLAWLDRVLAEHRDADHKIVMGHTPVLTPVRAENSSRLTLQGGRDSDFWRTLSRHRVDLYLCGEVHAITCTLADGVWQVAHGSLFGYNTSANYLVARVAPGRIRLELKEIETVLGGGHVPQSAGNQPRESVRITDEAKREGLRTIGSMVIDKTAGTPRYLEQTGAFAETYDGKKK
ncbi:MAG: metallophosphoesterase [Planctomycetes bacterium]|nr:metallophosphoesterase [Planctomycetota bacterium]